MGASDLGRSAAAARAWASAGSSLSWRSMASTPCSMPRSKWPSRKEGRISFWMIRADRASVRTGSSP